MLTITSNIDKTKTNQNDKVKKCKNLPENDKK